MVFTFLLDENTPAPLCTAIDESCRQKAWRSVDVLGGGASDDALLKWAEMKEAVIVTENEKHFRRHIATAPHVRGAIFLKQQCDITDRFITEWHVIFAELTHATSLRFGAIIQLYPDSIVVHRTSNKRSRRR